ncbi:hypothetical protein M885DRAFT_615298 [Pelagophyceae sp. CCMP2097]|nr:hypothetical protein M885DRAFT_615298 [Pelagophyceae sp. CCMP2097]
MTEESSALALTEAQPEPARSERQLARSVAAWLKQARLDDGVEELDVARACILEAFDLGNADDEAITSHSLQDIFDAGVAALDARTLRSAVDAAKDEFSGDAVFQSYVTCTEATGYFDACETDSDIHRARFLKLVDRYRATSPKPPPPRRGAVVVPAVAAPEPPRLSAEQRVLRDPRLDQLTTSESLVLRACGLDAFPVGVLEHPDLMNAILANPAARRIVDDLLRDPELVKRFVAK